MDFTYIKSGLNKNTQTDIRQRFHSCPNHVLTTDALGWLLTQSLHDNLPNYDPFNKTLA